jgi:hypothetical protein
MTGRAVGSTSTEPPTIAATQLAFAICVALVVLNLYASQVLVRPITASYGIPDGATGLVTTAGLIGYSIGLLLLTPLADVMENRRLITLLPRGKCRSAAHLRVGATLRPAVGRCVHRRCDLLRDPNSDSANRKPH